jgi:hypothetical protein
VREDSWLDARWYSHPGPEPTDVAVASIDFLPEKEFKALLLRSDPPGRDICATSDVMRARNIGRGGCNREGLATGDATSSIVTISLGWDRQ